MFRAVKSIVRANFINQPMMIGRSKVERVPKPLEAFWLCTFPLPFRYNSRHVRSFMQRHAIHVKSQSKTYYVHIAYIQS